MDGIWRRYGVIVGQSGEKRGRCEMRRGWIVGITMNNTIEGKVWNGSGVVKKCNAVGVNEVGGTRVFVIFRSM